MLRIFSPAALAVLCLSGCSTLDLSNASCGVAKGRCVQDCRDALGGSAQVNCEDRCRAEAQACENRRSDNRGSGDRRSEESARIACG